MILRDLQADGILLRELQPTDVEPLVKAMHDPEIWLDHSWPDQWKPEVARRWVEHAQTSWRTTIIYRIEKTKYLGLNR